MSTVDEAAESKQRGLPRWLSSIRAKITLPYVLLAMLVALAGAYIVTRLIVESIEERFVNQLMESGRLLADRVVAIEDENLDVVRALARTEGLAEAVAGGDRSTLDRLSYPIVVNAGAEAVQIIDMNGETLYSLRHVPGGGPADYERGIVPLDWRHYAFVAKILQGEIDTIGDKYSGLVDAPWGYGLYTAGPIVQSDEPVGVVLVGRYLESMPNDLRQASGAHHIILYDAKGALLATSFPPEDREVLRLSPDQAARILAEQDLAVSTREIRSAGRLYHAALGPLELRQGEDVGLFSVSLVQSYLVQASPITQVQLVLLVVAAFVAVILLGTLVAQRISRPILEVARASRRVAAGNLDQRVPVRTRDEVADMAEAFNKMLAELQKAQRIRDIFGRAVSPAVSQLLIEAMDRGQISLTGENRTVTAMFTDIRGFTALSESLPPEELLGMLNEVLGTFIKVIGEHGGVVNKFGGDSILAIFGAPIPQPDHARRAADAGLVMARRLDALNAQRRDRGLIPVEVGIGLNTGEVVAGLTGSAERLEYTVIGDSVNVAARVQGLARQYVGRTLFITGPTLEALGPEPGLELEDLGLLPLRGKAELVQVYAVLVPRSAPNGPDREAAGGQVQP